MLILIGGSSNAGTSGSFYFKTPYVDINQLCLFQKVKILINFKTPYVDINRCNVASNFGASSHFKTPYVDINPNKINAFLFTKMKLY